MLFDETWKDIQHGFQGKDTSIQSSTLILRLTEGFFGAFSRRWRPTTKYRGSRNLFTGFIDHVNHPKKILSVGFWSQIAQEAVPPRTANRIYGKNVSLTPSRFAPYQTEYVQYPFVIYVTIITLAVFFIIVALSKRSL